MGLCAEQYGVMTSDTHTHTHTHARERTHAHTHKAPSPRAGVQLVGHTSKKITIHVGCSGLKYRAFTIFHGLCLQSHATSYGVRTHSYECLHVRYCAYGLVMKHDRVYSDVVWIDWLIVHVKTTSKFNFETKFSHIIVKQVCYFTPQICALYYIQVLPTTGT